MTCCDAMRKTIAAWIGPVNTTLPHPMKHIWPDDRDGRVRCHLCGAEWGPVKAMVTTSAHVKRYVIDNKNDDMYAVDENGNRITDKPTEGRPRYE